MQEVRARIERAMGLVDSVEHARTRFEEMGYTVTEAPLEFETKTRQCIVPFEDGTVIHLLERPTGFLARMRRRHRLSARYQRKTQVSGMHALRFRRTLSFERSQPGLIDAVLRLPEARNPEESSSVESSSDESAYSCGWIETEAKHSIDGEVGSSTLLIPTRQPLEVPLIRISKSAYGFSDQITDHRNGVQGMFHMQIGVQHLDEARSAYAGILGIEPYDHVDPVQKRAIFNLENGELELIPVDIALEAGIRELSLRPGFPGHRVHYDPGRTQGISMRVTDVSARAALEPDEDEELEREGISRSRS